MRDDAAESAAVLGLHRADPRHDASASGQVVEVRHVLGPELRAGRRALSLSGRTGPGLREGHAFPVPAHRGFLLAEISPSRVAIGWSPILARP